MQKKVIIVSSGHPPLDERIFWKFGLTLQKNGYGVNIVSSYEELKTVKENVNISSFNGDNISKKEKINRFYLHIKDYCPDIIICCEPLPILAANKFRNEKKECKIISDITEWYPHQSHFENHSGLIRIIKYLYHFIFNIYATNLADHLFIGEELKAKLYKIIAPFKKRTIIGYYPPKRIFKYYPVKLKDNEINLCFCGLFTTDRGFDRILELTKLLSNRLLETKINLILVGKFANNKDRKKIHSLNENKNARVILREWTSYDLYNSQLADADICLDLRSKTKVLNRSLPIKVFDYMASGKPVIYSNVDAFYQLPEVADFGHLVDPDDYTTTTKIIVDYLNNPAKLIGHSKNARKLFEEKYNWELMEERLLSVICMLQRH